MTKPPVLLIVDALKGTNPKQTERISSTICRLQYRYRDVLVSNRPRQPDKNSSELTFSPARHTQITTRNSISAAKEALERWRDIQERTVHLCGMDLTRGVIPTAALLAKAGVETLVLANHCETPEPPPTRNNTLLVLNTLLGIENVHTDTSLIPPLIPALLAAEEKPRTRKARYNRRVRQSTAQEIQEIEEILLESMDDARTHNRALAALILESRESDQDIADKLKASVYFIQQLRRRINDIGVIQVVRGHNPQHGITALNGRNGTILIEIASQPPTHGKKRWTAAMLSKELNARGAEKISPGSVIRYLNQHYPEWSAQ